MELGKIKDDLKKLHKKTSKAISRGKTICAGLAFLLSIIPNNIVRFLDSIASTVLSFCGDLTPAIFDNDIIIYAFCGVLVVLGLISFLHPILMIVVPLSYLIIPYFLYAEALYRHAAYLADGDMSFYSRLDAVLKVSPFIAIGMILTSFAPFILAGIEGIPMSISVSWMTIIVSLTFLTIIPSTMPSLTVLLFWAGIMCSVASIIMLILVIRLILSIVKSIASTMIGSVSTTT